MPGLLRAMLRARSSTATILDRAEAYWKASEYNPATREWLKDLSGHGHHLRIGLTDRIEILDGALQFGGAVATYATSPDHASLAAITDDIEIVCKVEPDAWSSANTPLFVGRGIATGGSENTWALGMATSSTSLQFVYWTTGANANRATAVSSVGVPFADGAVGWVKVTRTKATGLVKFYTSTDGSSWSQLGTDITPTLSGTATTTGAMYTGLGAANISLGADSAGSVNLFAGRIYRVIIKSSIGGTTVFDADFSAVADGTPWFLDSTGKRVSLSGVRSAVVGGVLYTPGSSNNFGLSAPHPDLDITGDIELIWHGAADDWTPSGTVRHLIAKHTQAAATSSYALSVVNTSGLLRFSMSSGAALTTVNSSVAPTVLDGADLWVKATRRQSDGRVQFFTSNDGSVWTQLGTDVTLSSGTAMGVSPATALTLSSDFAGSANLFAGKVYRAIVKNGIGGTTVFDVDFSTWADGDGIGLAAWGGHPKQESTGKPVIVFSATAGSTTTDPKWLPYSTDPTTPSMGKGMWVAGFTSGYASVPDANNLDILGDLTVDCEVALDDWTPAATCGLVTKSAAINTAANGYRLIVVLTTGLLRLSWGNGAANQDRTSTVAIPAVDGQRLWVRATLDADNGAGGHDVKFFTSKDGVTWTQLGATVTTAGTTSIGANATEVEIGSVNAGASSTATGRFFRARIWNAYTSSGADPAGGNLILDADFTLPAVTEPHASFTTTTGQTVTINRAASGRKPVIVDRSGFLFGLDDFMEAPDEASLDFAAAESFSYAVAARQFGTTADEVFLAKKANTTTAAGYALTRGTANATAAIIADGTVATTDTAAAAATVGEAQVRAGVRAVGPDQIIAYTNSASDGATTDTTTATLANSDALRIGRLSGAGTNYASMEFFGAAVWREALTSGDIAALDAEFGTNA